LGLSDDKGYVALRGYRSIVQRVHAASLTELELWTDRVVLDSKDARRRVRRGLIMSATQPL